MALTIHLDHQAIFGDWQVEMKEGDTVTVSEGNPYRVEADQESVFTIDLKDADWPPDRAHVELHIRNARAPV